MDSTQQEGQRRAHPPGSLGADTAGAELGLPTPQAKPTSEKVEDAPTPGINADPVRSNVAFVYSSAEEAPGDKSDLGVLRTETEMEGSGEAAVRVGPGLTLPEDLNMP